MPKTPADAAKAMIANLPKKTGKSLEQWLAVAAPWLPAKHGEIRSRLKEEHGLTHGYANLIASCALESGGEVDLIAAQYAGAKEALRPIYDALVQSVQRLGSDVEIAPKKAYVSLRRAKQFAILQPSTKSRLDVGLVLKGVAPAARLEASGSFNAMVTHRIRVSSVEEVDEELSDWVRAAYQAAG